MTPTKVLLIPLGLAYAVSTYWGYHSLVSKPKIEYIERIINEAPAQCWISPLKDNFKLEDWKLHNVAICIKDRSNGVINGNKMEWDITIPIKFCPGMEEVLP